MTGCCHLAQLLLLPFLEQKDTQMPQVVSVSWSMSDRRQCGWTNLPVGVQLLVPGAGVSKHCLAQQLHHAHADCKQQKVTHHDNMTQSPPSSAFFDGNQEVTTYPRQGPQVTGDPAGTPRTYPLMRRDARDAVRGSLRLAFSWDVTARSLMSLMLKALEHVLQQRREILCMLSPISPYTAITWSSPGSTAASTATLQVSTLPSCLGTVAARLHAFACCSYMNSGHNSCLLAGVFMHIIAYSITGVPLQSASRKCIFLFFFFSLSCDNKRHMQQCKPQSMALLRSDSFRALKPLRLQSIQPPAPPHPTPPHPTPPHPTPPHPWRAVTPGRMICHCCQAEAMGYEGMAAKIMAKHSKEEHRSSLSITVIEARGLRPRHGTLCHCL